MCRGVRLPEINRKEQRLETEAGTTMNEKPKHILVTGGAGYIGSHTSKALSRRGFVPVTYDNLVYGHPWAVRWGPFIEGDIGDKAKLLDTIRQYQISAVIHF